MTLVSHSPADLESLLSELDADGVAAKLTTFDDDELEVTIQLTDNAALVNRLARIERGRRHEKLPPVRGDLVTPSLTRSERNARSEERKVAEWYDSQEQPIEEVAENGWKKLVAKARGAHVSHNSGNNEWYTPPQYLEAARRVMGGIDLDPASSERAQLLVKASVFYTIDDDGLERPWSGRVWMNPPYSSDLIVKFVGRLLGFLDSGDVSEAVVLVNNGTETAALRGLLESYDSICYHTTRIKFLDSTLNPANTPLQGQLFLYFGPNVERFRKEFSQFGVVR